eukprot:768473-Hanusia_phi.AAC.4
MPLIQPASSSSVSDLSLFLVLTLGEFLAGEEGTDFVRWPTGTSTVSSFVLDSSLARNFSSSISSGTWRFSTAAADERQTTAHFAASRTSDALQTNLVQSIVRSS